MSSIFAGRKVEHENCGVAKNIRYSAVEENRSSKRLILPVSSQHSRKHQFDKEPGILFWKPVSLNAPLLGYYRSSWFNDSSNATRLQMLQQSGFPAAEGPCQNEISINDQGI